jgi:hypothetical protein
MGVDAHFQEERTPEAIMNSLRAAGKKDELWVKELQVSRDPWFNINVGSRVAGFG